MNSHTMEERKQNEYPNPNSKDFYSNKVTFPPYQTAAWRANHKRPQASEVAKLKKELNKTISDLKSEIVSTIKNQADAGTPIDKLAAKIHSSRDGAAEVLKELNEIRYAIIPKGVSASDAGISFQNKQTLQSNVFAAQKEIFEEKTGQPFSGAALRAIGQILKVHDGSKWLEVNGVTFNDNKMLELVMLDDFVDVLKTGLKAGLKTASSFFPVAAPMLSAVEQFGDATGFFSKPSLQSNANIEAKVMPVLNKTSDSLGVSIKPSRFAADAVDVATIATILVPEFYKNVARFDDALPASTSTYFAEIPVIPTTANGSFFFVINNSVNVAGANFAFISYTGAASTYIPSNGSTITGITNIVNPLNALASTIGASRIVGVSVTYVPNVQNSTTLTNGQVEVYHDPSMSLATTDFFGGGTSVYLSQNNIGYKPFYLKGPVTAGYNQLYYNPLDNNPFQDVLQPTGTIESPIVVIVSGASTSGQQIGTIQVNIVYNNTPTSTGLSTQPVSNPRLGPYTADLMNSLLTEVPQVFMANIDARMDLITKFQQTDERYTTLMEVASGCCMRKRVANTSPMVVA